MCQVLLTTLRREKRNTAYMQVEPGPVKTAFFVTILRIYNTGQIANPFN